MRNFSRKTWMLNSALAFQDQEEDNFEAQLVILLLLLRARRRRTPFKLNSCSSLWQDEIFFWVRLILVLSIKEHCATISQFQLSSSP
jgi:hypothetical protein